MIEMKTISKMKEGHLELVIQWDDVECLLAYLHLLQRLDGVLRDVGEDPLVQFRVAVGHVIPITSSTGQHHHQLFHHYLHDYHDYHHLHLHHHHEGAYQ